MKRIIVDVTQLAHWQGKITGIPRVMDELARRFKDYPGAEVVYASWVKDQGEFYEIDFEATIVKREGIVYRAVGADGSGRKAVASAVPARSSARHLAKRVAKKGLRVAGRIHSGIAHRLEERAKRLGMHGRQKITFQDGDVFFIPWGEWWDPAFTDRLVLANKSGAKLVQIIHDVATTVWPQFFEQVAVSPTTYNSRIVPIADLVLCVSRNTKKELTGWLNQEKLHVPRMEVFRLGDDVRASKPRKPDDEAFMAAGLKGKDYLLCVGTIEAKKNHALFYYVYKMAAQRGIELPKIAIVGRRGWGTENIYDMMTKDPEVKDKFVFLHDISDEELVWLFDNCLFTVLPSFHEGWGIPIAESLGRGIPCLSSNTSSMVEIAEGIVEHFSPTSAEECLAAIQRMLEPKHYKAAVARVKKYQPTSWDDSFKQVRAYVEEIL